MHGWPNTRLSQGSPLRHAAERPRPKGKCNHPQHGHGFFFLTTPRDLYALNGMPRVLGSDRGPGPVNRRAFVGVLSLSLQKLNRTDHGQFGVGAATKLTCLVVVQSVSDVLPQPHDRLGGLLAIATSGGHIIIIVRLALASR